MAGVVSRLDAPWLATRGVKVVAAARCLGAGSVSVNSDGVEAGSVSVNRDGVEAGSVSVNRDGVGAGSVSVNRDGVEAERRADAAKEEIEREEGGGGIAGGLSSNTSKIRVVEKPGYRGVGGGKGRGTGAKRTKNHAIE